MDTKVENQIRTFIFCPKCFSSLPEGESLVSYSRLDIGITNLGIQVWCQRCNANVVHFRLENFGPIGIVKGE